MLKFASSSHYAEVKDDGTGRILSTMSEGAEPVGQEVEPGVQQAISAVDKKKLDKEAKAREKKEKKETKRLLKEEERRIKAEAKKPVETPAERRHRQRAERRQNEAGQPQKEAGSHSNRSLLGLLSPKRPGVQLKNARPVKVHLLDGTDYDFELEVSCSFMCDCPQFKFRVNDVAFSLPRAIFYAK